MIADLERLAAAKWDAVIPPHGRVVKQDASDIYKTYLDKIKKDIK